MRPGWKGISTGNSTRRLSELYEFGPFRLQKSSLKNATAYISRRTLRRNAELIKKFCGPRVGLCAVVKADGYGHDGRLIVQCLDDIADYFAVSTIEEAEQIFPFASGRPILVTCPLYAGISPQLIRLAQVRRFHCTICSLSALDYVCSNLDGSTAELPVHIKINTGMNRVGCFGSEALTLLDTIKSSSCLTLAGVYTHFATADDPEQEWMERQLERFQEFLAITHLNEDKKVIKHACNTSAALRLPTAHFDMVRCGIGLYGYHCFIGKLLLEKELQPVLQLRAPLVEVRTLGAGQACGYGRSFIAQKSMTIGIIPVGYADGVFRNLSNRAVMLYDGKPLPVVGRVSMDLTILDLTNVQNPHEGMLVTVIDNQLGSPCDAAALADLAGTIPYEILASIGKRIKRELVD